MESGCWWAYTCLMLSVLHDLGKAACQPVAPGVAAGGGSPRRHQPHARASVGWWGAGRGACSQSRPVSGTLHDEDSPPASRLRCRGLPNTRTRAQPSAAGDHTGGGAGQASGDHPQHAHLFQLLQLAPLWGERPHDVQAPQVAAAGAAPCGQGHHGRASASVQGRKEEFTCSWRGRGGAKHYHEIILH